MPDLKISQLAAGTTPLAGAELVPIVQSGVTSRTTVGAILTGTVPAGTANGVAYLDGSKVLTTGSALVFDGTNLGIGTSSPGAPLDVNGAARVRGDFFVYGTGDRFNVFPQTAGNGVTLVSTNNTNTGYSGLTLDGAPIIFNYAGGEQMRLTGTGLGIGTSSPQTRLAVETSGTQSVVSPVITGQTSGVTYGGMYAVRDGAGDQRGLVWQTYTVNVGLGEKMRLESSGNLGLGVTPSAWGGQWRAFDIQNATGGGGFSSLYPFVAANAYNNGTNWIYKTTAAAGYYIQGQGTHQWYTAPSGTAGNAISFTQAMTLDASGNLALGATSATYRFDVTAATGSNGVIAVRAGANQNSTLSLAGNASTPLSGSFDLIQDQTQAYIYQRANQPLVFGTNNTERARIDASGNLLVGTTSALKSGKVSVNAAGINGVTCQVDDVINPAFQAWSATTTGDALFIDFITEGGAGTVRGSISYNRAGGLVAYNTTSDYRAKDIIGPITNPGATIDSLKVYEGKMKGATQSRPMLVAHEAQAIAPYAVTGEKDAVNEDGDPIYQQMDVSSLVPLLLAEIQSLRARVAALEAQP